MTSAKDLEQSERTKAGLPTYHSLDQRDIGFRFVHPNSPDEGAQAFLAGDLRTMETAWKDLDDIRGCVTFEPIPPQPLHELPAVETLFNTPSGLLPWFACDGHYFEKFGAKLLASIDGPAHVHLMDADPTYAKDVIAFLNHPVGLTLEQPGAGPEYYHAVRFCRFAQMLQNRSDPMVSLDADCLINQPISHLPIAPVAVWLSPGRIEPWNQCIATVVVGTQEAASYFSGVADYIFHYWKQDKLRWHIDQAALFAVWQRMRVNIRALSEKEADHLHQEDGIVWCNPGIVKWDEDAPSQVRFRTKFNAIQVPAP